ncbi:MAG: glycosyltransferase family 9 protein, partial [Verrucomicrobiota bacterium]|nr:glycosyltransferase family 9 protein [Verrucomicrobiota bacterium]
AYPEAEIWVALRKNCEGILQGCPAIDRIVTLAAPFREKREYLNGLREFKLICQLRLKKFDYLFELGDGHRARLFSVLVGAKKLYSVRPATPLKAFWRRRFHGISNFEWENRHRVEKDFRTVAQFLKLPDEIPPLIFERNKIEPWLPAAGLEDFAVIHPGTREPYKRWPKENWLEVGRYLLTCFKNIVISAGPFAQEIEEAEWLEKNLGAAALNTAGKTSWAQLADLLYRAKLFVGVDTAAMHLAAACQCPVVAIFGPSIEKNWHPWQSHYRIVSDPNFKHEKNESWHNRRIEKVLVEDVIKQCEEFVGKK